MNTVKIRHVAFNPKVTSVVIMKESERGRCNGGAEKARHINIENQEEGDGSNSRDP